MGLSSKTYMVSSRPFWAAKRNLIFENQTKLSNNPHLPHCEANHPIAARKNASNLCWESMQGQCRQLHEKAFDFHVVR